MASLNSKTHADRTYLPKVELAFYTIAYLFMLLTSFVKVCNLSEEIKEHSEISAFTDGWRILGDRLKDDTDFEWAVWRSFLEAKYNWFILHLVASEISRFFASKTILYVHSAVGLLFLVVTFHYSILLLLLAMNGSFYVIVDIVPSRLNGKRIVWTMATVWIVVLNIGKLDAFQDTVNDLFNVDDFTGYQLFVTMAWHLLKCISFTLDKCDAEDKERDSDYTISHLMAFTFYFPTMFFGPILVYSRYRRMTYDRTTSVADSLRRLGLFAKSIGRTLFWYWTIEGALHFIYVNTLQYNVEMIRALDTWQLFGTGVLISHFFHAKYVVSYGFSMAFARADGIETPATPKCISSIHFFSEMWKSFDQGLYEFLFVYIYLAACPRPSSTRHKMVASFLTFAFIFAWHGIYLFTLVWAATNYLCLGLEKLYRWVVDDSHQFRLFATKYLSHDNELRLRALMATQIFIPVVQSNLCFFGGLDVGYIVSHRFYGHGICQYLVMTSVCYCFFHICEALKRCQPSNTANKPQTNPFLPKKLL